MTAARWAWADVDLGAVAHNVEVVRRTVEPSAVWAVVKADGYGHGAVPVGRAALDAGCEGLCVALTAEAVALRDAGIDAPILLLSEQPIVDVPAIVAAGLTPTVYTTGYVDALAAAQSRRLGVHLKVDTGMRRVGCAPADAPGLAARIAGHAPWLRLAGVSTHLAVADDPTRRETDLQLEQLDATLAELPTGVIDGDVAVHVANSAGALAHPKARRSFVRSGIALYGVSPGPGVDPLAAELRPVMSLRARVSFVKRVPAGAAISYGLRHVFERDATVATVPLGYADGVPRRLSTIDRAMPVLIGGRRRPIVGVVTMDQLMVDCGDDHVSAGDEVVLLGRQGDEQIRAEEWAEALGTIGYEIVCGISRRVPRVVAAPARTSPLWPSR